MIWEHNGEAIPLEVYHGIPVGWRAEEIIDAHQKLGGTFEISGPEATEPGAPGWLPDRHGFNTERPCFALRMEYVLRTKPA